MATKLVNATQLDSNLTAIANAIRTKGDTSALLVFPIDFVSAIGAISGGSAVSDILTFDFTKGLSDQETGGSSFVLNGATRDSSGLHLDVNGASAVLTTPPLYKINLYGCVVEIDIGNMAGVSGAHRRLIMSDPDKGLIYRNTGQWQIYNNAWVGSGSTDIDFFANSTIRIEYAEQSNNVSIYKENTLCFDNIGFGGATYLSFGSTGGNSYYNVTITGCRIYTRDAWNRVNEISN